MERRVPDARATRGRGHTLNLYLQAPASSSASTDHRYTRTPLRLSGGAPGARHIALPPAAAAYRLSHRTLDGFAVFFISQLCIFFNTPPSHAAAIGRSWLRRVGRLSLPLPLPSLPPRFVGAFPYPLPHMLIGTCQAAQPLFGCRAAPSRFFTPSTPTSA